MSDVDQKPPRQPIFNIPGTIVVLIAAMGAVQAGRGLLSAARDARVLARFAFVPGRFTFAVDPGRILSGWAGMNMDDPAARQQVEIARFFLGDGRLQPWTPLTYAFLHGNWTHFGLNAIWLLAFGAPVARRFGASRFLLFFALGALAGAAAHQVVFADDLQPLIGASAAVSACMGATLRFMFQPQRRAALEAAEGRLEPSYRAPRVELLVMLRDRRALAFLLVWFATNIVTGLAAISWGLSDAPIAWQAHIGGFLLGLLAFPLFDPVIPPGSPRGARA